MNGLNTPKQLYLDYQSGKLSKRSLVNRLKILIESSPDIESRIHSLEVLNQITLENIDIYAVIEDLLVSDTHPRVRTLAAGIICTNYLSQGIESILWTIEHDKSPLVLQIITSKLKYHSSDPISQVIKNKLSEIAFKLGIVYDEAYFILDVEALFALHFDDYELNLDDYSHVKSLFNREMRDYWITVRENHVHSLTFNLFNWIFIKEHKDMILSFIEMQDSLIYFDLLRKLDFYQDNLKIIPESIRNLRYLKRLDLSYNYVEMVPPIILELKSLEWLNLESNLLKSLPDDFLHLDSLRYLNINNNKLIELPEKLYNLPRLETLKMSGNRLHNIPDSLDSFLKKLKTFEN